jgi:iron complex outermembrane receptor protein
MAKAVRRYRFCGALTLAAMTMTVPDTSSAQDAEALEEITVSAQKVAENAQEVPISITAITAEEIERAQVKTIKDAAVLFPNVNVSDIGSRSKFTSLAIRGLSNNFATPTLRAAVLVDDVPYAGILSLSSALFDVDQMELLRGPQSTLFGLTAEAGVLNVKTKRPRRESWGGETSLNVASAGEYEARFNVSGPVTGERWTAGIGAYWRHEDGFIENKLTGRDFNRTNTWAVRLRSVFEPTDSWNIDVTGAYQRAHDGFGQVMLPLDIAAFNADLNGIDGFQGNVGRFDTAQDYPGFSQLKTSEASVRAAYSGSDAFDIVLVTAFRDADGHNSFDVGMVPGPWLPIPNFPIRAGDSIFSSSDFSQEIRLVSRAGQNALSWVLGAYYYSNDFDQSEGINQLVPLNANSSDRHSWAVFGNAKYSFDSGIGLTTGLRYEHAIAKGHQDFDLFNPAIDDLSAQKTNSVVLPRFIVDYEWSKDAMVYASAARGWLPGGISIATPDKRTFDAEKMWNYELGAKSMWMNGRVRLNAAVFRSEIDDYQETTRELVITASVSNADKVRITGAEAELELLLKRGLSIAAAFGANHAEYTSFRNAAEDNTGNDVPGVPRYNGSLSLTYELPRGFYGRAEWLAVGKSLVLEDRANVFPKLDSYDVLNLQLGLDDARWSAFVFLDNVFDKRYFTAAFDQLNDGRLLGAVGHSRQYGVRIGYTF